MINSAPPLSTRRAMLAKLKAKVDDLHLGGMREMVDLLAAKGFLRPGRSRARAA